MLALTIAQVRAYCLIIGCGTIWMAIMLHRGKWPTYSINDLSWISSWLSIIQIAQRDVLAFWFVSGIAAFTTGAAFRLRVRVYHAFSPIMGATSSRVIIRRRSDNIFIQHYGSPMWLLKILRTPMPQTSRPPLYFFLF